MTDATRALWPGIYVVQGAADGVLCPHLGVVDFILWW